MSKGLNLWYLIYRADLQTWNTLYLLPFWLPKKILWFSPFESYCRRVAQRPGDWLQKTPFKRIGGDLGRMKNLFFSSYKKRGKFPPGPELMALQRICHFLPLRALSFQSPLLAKRQLSIWRDKTFKGEDGELERMRERGTRRGSCRSSPRGARNSGANLPDVLINWTK